jgi:carboxymethylenebutenolidase
MNVESTPVDLATARGPMRVHVHAPAPSASAASSPETTRRYPAIALYSEIYQETGPIRRAALRIAGHGYVVAVPEVFHEHEPLGTVLTYDAEGTDKGNRYKYATALATYDADARLALDHLKSHPQSSGKLGAIGWCLGGHLAFRAALNADVLATACFYPTDLHGDTLGAGQASDSKARTLAGDVKGELLLAFGRQDPHVPAEGRRVIYDLLAQAKTRFSWHEFNAAHAFMRDEGPRYDPALAAIGFGLALEMFERVLR